MACMCAYNVISSIQWCFQTVWQCINERFELQSTSECQIHERMSRLKSAKETNRALHALACVWTLCTRCSHIVRFYLFQSLYRRIMLTPTERAINGCHVTWFNCNHHHPRLRKSEVLARLWEVYCEPYSFDPTSNSESFIMTANSFLNWLFSWVLLSTFLTFSMTKLSKIQRPNIKLFKAFNCQGWYQEGVERRLWPRHSWLPSSSASQWHICILIFDMLMVLAISYYLLIYTLVMRKNTPTIRYISLQCSKMWPCVTLVEVRLHFYSLPFTLKKGIETL